MGKIILWIVIVFAVLFVLRLLNAKKQRRDTGAKEPPQAMIRCAGCGVYVPRADAKPGRAGLTCGDPVCLSR
jgi:uncharacterized protein